jgi:DNA-binding GntR family transcriptional regulator
MTSLIEKTAELLALEDMSVLRQLNKQFHSRIVESAQSQLLIKLYEMTTNAFPDWMLYEYMFRHPELLQDSLQREFQEHQAIISALAARDPDKAANQVAAHIKNQWHDLQTYLDISNSSIVEIENQIRSMFPNHHS